MSYQSLYRKFRPKTFDGLLGQEHITTTLKNQIINDSIAHAYLFTGTRGTGKTSAAKIFARAVNCLNNVDGNPCNECEVCKSILDDSIMDVVEMDAASNNSVEDIRDLREKAKYPPAKGRYKVYIVDEVHMLSKGAFNALLKTLEEPPKHLLFILATTEPQRLPTTIQSRCQRYDFKRIRINDIIQNMKNICTDLDIQVEERVLNLIARNADGAMRDALSILDQCISFTKDKLTYQHVLSILGIVNSDMVFSISNAILDKDINKSLQLVDEIVQNGKDVNQFIKDLILHFRNLMIVKSTDNVKSIVEGSKEFIEELIEQSQKTSLLSIMRCINILSESENQSKWSSQPRIILEIGIIKLCDNDTDLSIEELANRVVKLEKLIKNGETSVIDKNSNKNNSKDSNKEIKSDARLRKPLESFDNNGGKKTLNGKTQDSEKLESNFSKSIVNIDFQDILKNWSDILKTIKKERISIHALIMEGKPLKLQKNTLIISFEEGFAFHKDAIDKKKNKDYIQGVINKYFNTELEVKFIMSNEEDNFQRQTDKNSKIVEKVKEVFGEDLVEIK